MAGEIAPEDQDKLAQLFGGKLGGNPGALLSAMGPGAGTAMGGVPVGVAPAAQATDDPTLQARTPPTSPMPGAGAPPVVPPSLPMVPSFQNPPVDKMQDLSGKIAAASQPILRKDYQPHWWERLLAPLAGGITGATQGAGAGMAQGEKILDRRYNRAQEAQKSTLAPLEAEFERQGKIEPYIRDVNKNSQDTFNDQDAAYKNFNVTQDRQDAIAQRADAAKGRTEERQDEASNTPAPGARPELYMQDGKPALHVRTKTGEYIPYIPKSIDEGAMLNDPTSTRLYNRAHPGKEDKGDKEASKAKFETIEANKQTALNKAEDEYTKEIDDLDDSKKLASRGGKTAPDDSAERARALLRLQSKKDRAQNAYESETVAAGGTVNKTPVSSATQPASATSGGTAPRSVGKDVVQKYADSHKMTYDDALKGFQSKGYQVK